jgi:hypothetical protein
MKTMASPEIAPTRRCQPLSDVAARRDVLVKTLAGVLVNEGKGAYSQLAPFGGAQIEQATDGAIGVPQFYSPRTAFHIGTGRHIAGDAAQHSRLART